MNKIKNLFYLAGTIILTAGAHAKNKLDNNSALMTAYDIQNSQSSHITITNHTAQTISASGLFIASFDINDCSVCYGAVLAGDNAAGAFASTVTFKPNQSLPIGSNFLYNMLYNGIYFVNTVVSSPCALPGCSWPGDDPSVTGWCISINVASIHSSYTYSTYTNGSNPPANFPSYSAAGNAPSYGYNYDLINPATLGAGGACLGPITCNDQTMTCKVASDQGETFESY